MRRIPTRIRVSRSAGPVAVLAGALVAGCATIDSVLGPIGLGGTQPAPQSGAAASSTVRAEVDCPTVTVRSGAAAWQIPGGASPTNVRYQGSIGQLARECAVLGDTMTMRVGVEGRVLVGPKGGPGSVTVPIRMALVQEGPQPRPIWSKFYTVPVTIPPNASQAIFSQVEDDLTFALPPDRRTENFVVYVGFDPQGAPAAARKTKTPPRTTTKAPPKAAPAKTAKAPAPAAQKQPPPRFEPAPTAPSNVFAPPPGHK